MFGFFRKRMRQEHLRLVGENLRMAEALKQSDRHVSHPEELKSVISFAKKHHISSHIYVLTKTLMQEIDVSGVSIHFVPVSGACFLMNKIWVDELLVAGKHPRPEFLSGLPSPVPSSSGAAGPR